jgi:hypothetical protein
LKGPLGPLKKHHAFLAPYYYFYMSIKCTSIYTVLIRIYVLGYLSSRLHGNQSQRCSNIAMSLAGIAVSRAANSTK